MKLTYDPEVDAAYLRLAPRTGPGGTARSEESTYLDCFIALDFDHDDRIVGIEILSASKIFSAKALSEADPA